MRIPASWNRLTRQQTKLGNSATLKSAFSHWIWTLAPVDAQPGSFPPVEKDPPSRPHAVGSQGQVALRGQRRPADDIVEELLLRIPDLKKWLTNAGVVFASLVIGVMVLGVSDIETASAEDEGRGGRAHRAPRPTSHRAARPTSPRAEVSPFDFDPGQPRFAHDRIEKERLPLGALDEDRADLGPAAEDGDGRKAVAGADIEKPSLRSDPSQRKERLLHVPLENLFPALDACQAVARIPASQQTEVNAQCLENVIRGGLADLPQRAGQVGA